MKKKDIFNVIVENSISQRIKNVILTIPNIALKNAIISSQNTNCTIISEYGFDKTLTADNLRPAIRFEASKSDYANTNLTALLNMSNASLEKIIQRSINYNVTISSLFAFAGAKGKLNSSTGTVACWNIKSDCISIVREILKNQLKVMHLQGRRIEPLDLTLDNAMDICIEYIKDGATNNDINTILKYTEMLQEVISSKKACS